MGEDAPVQETERESDEDSREIEESAGRGRVALLLVSILLIALCGISYELIIGTISSYFLGNSVLEFSLTIGLFMSAMGLGSYVSKFFVDEDALLGRFFIVEILIGMIGGLTSPVLFMVFATSDLFRPIQIAMILSVGLLVGLEIPLLTRYIRRYSELRVAISQVLSWDYIGALVGSVAFPLVLLPQLGLIGSSLAVGLVNIGVAIAGIYAFRKELRSAAVYLVACAVVALGLVGLFIASDPIERYLDSQLYRDQIIYSEQTQYQKIVVTRWRDDVRLFLNGNIQLSSVDEYRYHESLVHIPMAMAERHERVLVLGGGDGMVVRELQQWGDAVKVIHLVDLDPGMTRMGASFPALVALNGGSLEDPRVTIYNEDAMSFLERIKERYDVVIIDLPDPNHEALSKLYSRSFFRLLRARMNERGVAVTQSSSVYYSRQAFWCIHRTMEAAFCPGEPAEDGTCTQASDRVLPYHVNVPTFGDWGFNVASPSPLPEPAGLDVETGHSLRFLHNAMLPALFTFPKDEGELDVGINRLIDPVLLHYYLEDWSRWNI